MMTYGDSEALFDTYFCAFLCIFAFRDISDNASISEYKDHDGTSFIPLLHF